MKHELLHMSFLFISGIYTGGTVAAESDGSAAAPEPTLILSDRTRAQTGVQLCLRETDFGPHSPLLQTPPKETWGDANWKGWAWIFGICSPLLLSVPKWPDQRLNVCSAIQGQSNSHTRIWTTRGGGWQHKQLIQNFCFTVLLPPGQNRNMDAFIKTSLFNKQLLIFTLKKLVCFDCN